MNKRQMIFTHLYILFLLFTSCKLELNIEQIYIQNEEKLTLNAENNVYYHFILNTTMSGSVKFVVEEKDNNEDYINHIISYYQDPEFKDRKQLAQSLTDTTFMWLSKNQIKEDFYLSVECAKTPCKYTLEMIPEEYPELKLGQQYTYYMTEENEDEVFLININKAELGINATNNTVLIYARGSQYLNTNLIYNGTLYKHDAFEAYIINFEDLSDQYYFKVKGKPGAFINIGVLLYGGELDNTLENVILENGIEYTGVLYKGLIEKNCYKIPKNKNVTMNVVSYDQSIFYINQTTEENDNYNLHCISLDEYLEYYILNIDKMFYTVQFIYNSTDDGQGMNKYPKIVPNVSYTRSIPEGEMLILNQLEPEDNYKYLSFFAFCQTKIKVLSHICDTYPLCPINSETVKNSKSIREFYDTYSYSFTKEEIGQNISPISKKQHFYIIICEEGDYYDNNKVCNIDFSSYNNNTKFGQNYYEYVYIRKDDETNIDPFLNSIVNPEDFGEFFIVVKVYSGDLSVKISNNSAIKYFEYKNEKVIYTLIQDLMINIKANTDSVYRLESYNRMSIFLNDSYSLHKNNYLINFDDDNNFITISPFFYSLQLPNYAAFYPINCNITVEKATRYDIDGKETDKYVSIPKRYGFFQEIRNNTEIENVTQIGYKITANEDDYGKCLLSVGFFYLDNKVNEDDDGMILEYNISYPFIFEENYTDPVLFLYFFGNNYSDFTINIKVKKNNKYKIDFYVNNININKTTEFNSTEQILMQSSDWENVCDDVKQLCVLSLLMKSENPEESKVDIIISSSDYIPDEEDSEEEKKDEEEEKKEEEEEKKDEEEEKKDEEEEHKKEEEEEHKKEEEEEEGHNKGEEEEGHNKGEEEEDHNKEEEGDHKKDEEEENKEEEEDDKKKESDEGDGGNNNNNGNNNEEPKKDEFPTVLIIVISIAGVIVIIGIVCLILRCRKKNTNEDIEKLNIEEAFKSDVPLI